MKFAEFIGRWHDGSLHDIASWRAYAVEENISPAHIISALKMLGLTYAGDLAMPQFMASYGLTNKEESRTMLGAWYRLKMIEDGRRIMAKPRGPQLNLDLGFPTP